MHHTLLCCEQSGVEFAFCRSLGSALSPWHYAPRGDTKRRAHVLNEANVCTGGFPSCAQVCIFTSALYFMCAFVCRESTNWLPHVNAISKIGLVQIHTQTNTKTGIICTCAQCAPLSGESIAMTALSRIKFRIFLVNIFCSSSQLCCITSKSIFTHVDFSARALLFLRNSPGVLLI